MAVRLYILSKALELHFVQMDRIPVQQLSLVVQFLYFWTQSFRADLLFLIHY